MSQPHGSWFWDAPCEQIIQSSVSLYFVQSLTCCSSFAVCFVQMCTTKKHFILFCKEQYLSIVSDYASPEPFPSGSLSPTKVSRLFQPLTSFLPVFSFTNLSSVLTSFLLSLKQARLIKLPPPFVTFEGMCSGCTIPATPQSAPSG